MKYIVETSDNGQAWWAITRRNSVEEAISQSEYYRTLKPRRLYRVVSEVSSYV